MEALIDSALVAVPIVGFTMLIWNARLPTPGPDRPYDWSRDGY